MRILVTGGGGYISSHAIVALCYFNPVGIHECGRFGESASGIPNNLVSFHIAPRREGDRAHCWFEFGKVREMLGCVHPRNPVAMSKNVWHWQQADQQDFN